MHQSGHRRPEKRGHSWLRSNSPAVNSSAWPSHAPSSSRPEILILDEPTASLDGDTGRNIVRFVREHILSDHCCIVIVTHDSRIYEFADRIMRMEDGKLTGS